MWEAIFRSEVSSARVFWEDAWVQVLQCNLELSANAFSRILLCLSANQVWNLQQFNDKPRVPPSRCGSVWENCQCLPGIKAEGTSFDYSAAGKDHPGSLEELRAEIETKEPAGVLLPSFRRIHRVWCNLPPGDRKILEQTKAHEGIPEQANSGILLLLVLVRADHLQQFANRRQHSR